MNEENENTPAVSVIIPVFNVEEYLAECLESVISQTLKKIEIICVDDGSTDLSNRIIKEYAEKDNRIIIIEKENGGLSSARNAGIKVANGQYVQFVDADDKICPNACEIAYEAACRNNLDILYFGAEAFFETEELRGKNLDKVSLYTRKREYDGVYIGRKLFAELLLNNDYIESACLQLIKHDAWKDLEWFYEGILHEDVVFTFKSMLEAKRVSCIADKLYLRRVRENSITTLPVTEKKLYSHFICYKEILFELAKLNLNQYEIKAVCELLRRLRWRIGDDYYRLPTEERNNVSKYMDNEIDNYLYYNLLLPSIKDDGILARLHLIENDYYRMKGSLSY